MGFLRSPFKTLARKGQQGPLMWALRDVSFEVAPGEVLGVIGRNGAGKSTLLKILSRITDPTEGRVELYGRVGSLLEVGTGFHPELTGRENIYLNGTILGMRKHEIDLRFDEIVAFSEVEKFLDTAVKYYSSGMYTKLAFSVAAHLEPEILVVDEVLAVGDAAFQKKCLGKMREVAGGGRTVLFVSHNSAAIEALCTRCIWLRDGSLEASGDPVELLQRYLIADGVPADAEISLLEHAGRSAGSRSTMRKLTLLSSWGTPATTFRMGENLEIRVEFFHPKAFRPVLGVAFRNVTGAPVFGVNNRFLPAPSMPDSAREGAITCTLEKPPFMPGRYFIDLYLGDEYRDFDVIREAASFDVEAADVFGTGQLPPSSGGPICWGARYMFSDHVPELALVRNSEARGEKA